MINTRFIYQNFKKFLRFHRPKLILIYVLTVFLAFSQGFGFLMLIPLLGLLEINHQAPQNDLIQTWFYSLAERINISVSFETILIFYVLILSILFLLQNRKAIIQSAYQHQYSGYVRKELYRKVLFSDWAILNRISKAQHIQSLTSEIPKATHFYFYLLNASTKVIIFSIHIILAFLVSYELTLIVLISGFLQFFLLSKFFKKSYYLGKKGRTTFRRVLKNIDDFWITIKPAKIHNTEDYYFEQFAKADDNFVNNQVEQYAHNQKPQLLFRLLALFNMVVIIVVAQHFFHTPLALMILLVLIFSRIFPLFMNIYNDVNQMVLNAESLVNLNKMNFAPHSTPAERKECCDEVPENEIKIENICFGYSEQRAIFNEFSARIKAKSITGITGESGSGKTTLIDLISGLLFPEKGKIIYDHLEMNRQNVSVLRKKIAYLPQDSLFIDGTIKENLLWDTTHMISENEIIEVLKQVNAYHFINEKKLDLNSEIINFKYSFSGGELQRLALARVLLRKPSLLILDEASSALDQENEEKIMELLKSMSASVTIIFVTHKQSLFQYFDNVIKL